MFSLHWSRRGWVRLFFCLPAIAWGLASSGDRNLVLAQDSPVVVAIAGRPFGVAQVRLPHAPRDPQGLLLSLTYEDKGQRVLFPVWRETVATGRSGPPLQPIPPGRGVGGGRVINRITNAIRTATSKEIEQSVGTEMWFLFQGDEPFTIGLGESGQFTVPVRPQAATSPPLQVGLEGKNSHALALEQWWTAYTDSLAANLQEGDYPPLVEGYLVGFLARRLGLPIPEKLRPEDELAEESIASTVELIVGTEKMRNRFLLRAAQGADTPAADALVVVPESPQWQSAAVPEPIQEKVELEPIAGRVPQEMFYIRFGAFQNYLWCRDLGNQFGGDISRMIALRGIDYQATSRTEQQLASKTTELTRMLGDTFVEDMVLIGRDLFVSEGASLGVILKARNAFLLGTSLRGERSAVAKKEVDASITEVTLEGRPVSLLSTPDNRIRSFLVEDGEYFLITNSEAIARRFLSVRDGKDTLATHPGFRYARELMPQANDYLVFAYFSEHFLQGLVSPQYQIELRRRMEASADIALVQLAQVAAQGEGRTLRQTDELIREGYLPSGFGTRGDGSGPVVTDTVILDSLRGRSGFFLPIADRQLEQITREELAWYEARAKFYAERWRQMDPIVAGIRRQASPGGGFDRLHFHVEVAPLVPEKYGWIAKQLGPPTHVSVQFGPDDIVGAQAYVVSDLVGSLPPHHLFLGVKDSLLPNPAELDGFFEKYFALKSLSGYLGAWPQPGLIDRLPLGLGQGKPVGPGMTRLIGGLYRYQGGGFSILSFLPEVIQASLPYLAIADSLEPAQVRLHVDNLKGTQLETWVNQQVYRLNYKSSRAGARLLESLSSQLHVPASEAPRIVDALLDAKLQCPLGGDYRLRNESYGASWESSAWPVGGPQSPAKVDAPVDYSAPLLQWFRGASARLTQYNDRLVADMVFDIEMPKSQQRGNKSEVKQNEAQPAGGRRGSL